MADTSPKHDKHGIRELLAEASLETPRQRVDWVVEHLGHYVGRWVGACLYMGIPVARLAETGLYTILIEATEVLQEEIRELSPASERVSHAFEEVVKLIRNEPKRKPQTEANPIDTGLRQLKQALDSTEDTGTS